MDFALVSLGDHLADPHTGRQTTQADKFQLVIDHAIHGERAGFDSIMLGEHHYCDYILSSPQVVLGAIAARTTTMRLNTGVTLLPTLDPVRVAEDFTTLDVISGGRAEVTVGRGILPSAYAAVDKPIEASREIFAESADLLLQLLRHDKLTWQGRWRSPLDHVSIEPRSVQRPHLPVWVAGGSSASSVDLAAEVGARLMLPGVFAPAAFFESFAARYRERFTVAGHPAEAMRVGNVFHTHVAATSQEARRRWEPYYRNYLSFVDAVWDGQALFDGKVRPRQSFDYHRLLASTAICGSPAQVTERILEARELLGLDLVALSMDLGALPRDLLMESIELVGSTVIPAVKGGPTS
jgi:alkanesulfonate monooxygenase SsuD/methylene tetrahydromethanopterin reductase-like flavin-dependent oxidoreductase (luciferase family)